MTNQTPCNYRTPYKPQIEYYDEQMVIVNGVQYQRVEPPKPQTLYEVLYEKGGMYSSVCADVCGIVAYWLPDKVVMDKEEPIVDVVEYHRGWDNCIKYLKENLK